MKIEKIKNALIHEKSLNIENGLYYYTQIYFSYNSNKIEGSILTKNQTEKIFTNSFINSNKIGMNDIIESQNHFKLFDFILDNYDKELSKEMVLEMHRILKNNTSDGNDNIGVFKKNSNVIGIIESIETTAPEKVSEEIGILLNKYNSKAKKTLEDIIDFHVVFERIHPFNDGNGRLGRIIMFKECLKNNLMPFIIIDEDKPFYLRGLKEYSKDKMYLIDTCRKMQDIYEYICEQIL